MNNKLFLSIAIVSLANSQLCLAMSESPNDMFFRSFRYGVINKDLVKTALDKGANINLQDGIGFTLLHWAVLNKDSDLANLLLDKGINTNIKSNYGYTALEMAKRMGDRQDTVKIIEDWQNKLKRIKEIIIESNVVPSGIGNIIADYVMGQKDIEKKKESEDE